MKKSFVIFTVKVALVLMLGFAIGVAVINRVSFDLNCIDGKVYIESQ